MDAQCSTGVHRSLGYVPAHEEAMCEASGAKHLCDRVKECHRDQLQAKTKRDPVKSHLVKLPSMGQVPVPRVRGKGRPKAFHRTSLPWLTTSPTTESSR